MVPLSQPVWGSAEGREQQPTSIDANIRWGRPGCPIGTFLACWDGRQAREAPVPSAGGNRSWQWELLARMRI